MAKMYERDFDKQPYSSDEFKVVQYFQEIVPEIGAGDDPIGFLIASHRSLRHVLKTTLEGQVAKKMPERKDSGC